MAIGACRTSTATRASAAVVPVAEQHRRGDRRGRHHHEHLPGERRDARPARRRTSSSARRREARHHRLRPGRQLLGRQRLLAVAAPVLASGAARRTPGGPRLSCMTRLSLARRRRARRGRVRPELRPRAEPVGAAVRRLARALRRVRPASLALGHRTLLSDLYWLSTVQYIGEPQADQRGWDKLYPLVDLVTDLDPRHGYAYQTAGIVLSAAGRLDECEPDPREGDGEGAALVDVPLLHLVQPLVLPGRLRDGRASTRGIAARTPGASPNISHLALSLSVEERHARGRHRACSRSCARGVKDEATAARLDEQLKLAVLERDAQALERAAARFRAERGRARSATTRRARRRRARPGAPGGSVRRALRAGTRTGEVRSTANPSASSAADGPHAPGFHYKPPSQRGRRRCPSDERSPPSPGSPSARRSGRSSP